MKAGPFLDVIPPHHDGLVQWYRDELTKLGVEWSMDDAWQELGIKHTYAMLNRRKEREQAREAERAEVQD